MADPTLLGRRSFEASALMAQHPPRWANPNKAAVAEISCPANAEHRGTITVTRWRAADPAGSTPVTTEVVMRRGFFAYAPPAESDRATHWHVNFADPSLFGFGEGPLFAQDEMQSTEHPSLLAVKNAMRELRDDGLAPLTAENDVATPVLVAGVERRCEVRTNPSTADGRPYGLYGNLFRNAPRDAVLRATRSIDPPTISNFIAIAALAYGRGEYKREQIASTLSTAFTGFRAARLESPAFATVHTGYWGCGAFGGNRVLMTAIQILAARFAGVERLEYWIGSAERDAEAFEEGCSLAAAINTEASAAIEALVAREFRWGQSDGN